MVKSVWLAAGGAGAFKAREMIEREVRVLRQLHHPQVPAYLEDLVTGAGKSAAFHLVQEIIPGVVLATQMIGHRYDEGEVLDVLIAILPVVVYLHGLSPPVIHRDVKPRNI
ncbi:MAG: serine/threonine protein kinase, partial [Myxococcales bacterium]|nr:serine/threonine protein kinase [Myxococcales bacterium]